jgi:hypothetical protein
MEAAKITSGDGSCVAASEMEHPVRRDRDVGKGGLGDLMAKGGTP